MSRDRRKIEGTEERARDRGEPFGFEFFSNETANASRYLGDPDDVEAIIREFASEAYEARRRAAAGEISPEDGLAALTAAVARYAGIFYGKEPGAYRAQGDWNTPDRLGRHIIERLGAEGDPEDAAAALFWNVANQILKAQEEYAAGSLSDEDAQFRIAASIEDAQKILLGLPHEE